LGDDIYDAIHDPTIRWNGWLCPSFTRETVEQMATDFDKAASEYEDMDRITFDGDDVLIHSPVYEAEDGYKPERITPDADGLYSVGAFAWCWYDADDEG
jgi:hypothetical protein